ncbi:MAG: inositol monophosphatase [Deltaproteobacteria bacterium]|jgi:myo-inositol-1(or 4)-monophosphatase|nr:inositol monophosphatase [Deltaproteobacteria bacterium]
MNLEPFKQTAIEAARKSAKILRSRFGNISRIRQKENTEIVTEADTESEEVIISTIHTEFPDHAVLGEECGLIKGASEYKWIVDPLDGTLNFAHQIPIFSISIALVVRDTIVLGIILDPVSDELYTAVRGLGAQLNNEPIQVSATRTIAESLLVTGFPYNVREIFEPVMIRYASCLKASQGMRRLGSAALDLCYVACGRFEGFWEQNLKPWDSAAGALMVVEAGGRVTTFADRPYTVEHAEILATNGLIHKEMLGLLEI